MAFFVLDTVVMLLPQINIVSGVTPFYQVTILWLST